MTRVGGTNQPPPPGLPDFRAGGGGGADFRSTRWREDERDNPVRNER